MLSGRDVGAGGRGARVGLARELPPQRDIGRPPALLCGGAGPCRGRTAAPVALRRGCARWRGAGCTYRTAGSGGAELGESLAPFGAVPGPRCSAFSLPLTVLAAPCVAGFLGSRWTCRLGLLGTYSGRAAWRDVHGACAFQCVACERRSDATHPVFCCSPSYAGSFLPTSSRAARGISRQTIALSCPAPSKYPGYVADAQVDGHGSHGVSRRLLLEVACWP